MEMPGMGCSYGLYLCIYVFILDGNQRMDSGKENGKATDTLTAGRLKLNDYYGNGYYYEARNVNEG